MILVLGAMAVLGACGHESGEADGGGEPAKASGAWNKAPRVPGRVAGFQKLSASLVDETAVIVAQSSYDQKDVNVLAYDTSTDRWTVGSDSGIWWRFGSATVATDRGVLLHGGCCGPAGEGSRAPGFFYDVERDEWTEISKGPLANRFGHSGVWTGKEVLLWGGSGPGSRAEGAAYNPKTETWRTLAPASLAPREGHVSVWNGNEMVVWGGVSTKHPERPAFLRSGAAYQPEANRWRKIARAPISPQLGPDAEPDATEAVWTGREILVWNGAQGAAYDFSSDSWRRIAPSPLPQRDESGTDSMVWTGDEMLVWGGVKRGVDFLNSGAAYDPDSNRWGLLPASPIEGRDRHATTWIPDGMLIWGGCCGKGGYFRDGAFYSP